MRVSSAFTVWIFHQGAPNNRFYSLHLRKPRVLTTAVTDEKTGGRDTLFETPDPFLFCFCLYGFEKRLKFQIPRGSVRRLSFTADDA